MHVQNHIPVILRHLEEQVVSQYPRVVDQNIQLPKMTCGLVHRILYHSAVRHVAVKHQSFRTKAANFMGYLLTPLVIDVGERDTRALFSHAQGCRCSDASSGSSDKGNTPIKSSHTGTLSFSPTKSVYANKLNKPISVYHTNCWESRCRSTLVTARVGACMYRNNRTVCVKYHILYEIARR